MIIEPAATPRVRFEVDAGGALLEAVLIDTGDTWSGDDATAQGLWQAHLARNATFLACLPHMEAVDFGRFDRDGVVVISVSPENCETLSDILATELPAAWAAGSLTVEAANV